MVRRDEAWSVPMKMKSRSAASRLTACPTPELTTPQTKRAFSRRT